MGKILIAVLIFVAALANAAPGATAASCATLNIRNGHSEIQSWASRPALDGCITQAEASALTLADTKRHDVSPFLASVDLAGAGLSRLTSVRFTVTPKLGAASKPVNVTYSNAYLTRSGYLTATSVRVPVFGLYAGSLNHVVIDARFQDGSSTTTSTDIPTWLLNDGLFDRPVILVPRTPGSSLGFDYFYVKTQTGYPVVIDTDGEVRWWMPGEADSMSSHFEEGEFLMGDPESMDLKGVTLDGRERELALRAPYTGFHHNFDGGKTGVLAEVNLETERVDNIESILVEMTDEGRVIKQWNLARIIGDYMRSQGDDAAAFVRPGFDWFHMNAATYDASDDSLIVSSRENFVIKLDYRTGAIRWILGDPAKYWHLFPSLRAKSLAIEEGSLAPIGQHAVSITSDGHLMVFNNGFQSATQPPGAPAGDRRTYSAVSAYEIDPMKRTARDVRRFDYGGTVFSKICSSAYEAREKSLLVNYAVAEGRYTRIVGINDANQVVFDFRYDTRSCSTSWNAVPIAFDGMTFQ